MRPNFTSAAAEQMWDAYFAEVDHLLCRGDPDDYELAWALREHLAEGFAAQPGQISEEARLATAIRRLGEPDAYLGPFMAESALISPSFSQHADAGTKAARAGRDRGVISELGSGFWARARRALAGGLTVFAAVLFSIFAAMLVLKPIWSNHVGLFRYPDGGFTFGIVANTTSQPDLLGGGTIVVALLGAALSAALLVTGLKLGSWHAFRRWKGVLRFA